MSVPPVAEEADSAVAKAANELILLTIAASHCTLESWWSVTMHARDAVAVPRCHCLPDSPSSAESWWPERESEMTGGVTSWVAKAPTARRRQSFIVN